MENQDNHHKHYNLYYIFEADRQTNFMSAVKAETVRENIFENLSKKIKPSYVFPPPD